MATESEAYTRVGTDHRPVRSKNLLYQGLTALIGAWVFLSVFVWPYSSTQGRNTWMTGVGIFVFGLIAILIRRTRFLNTILGAWLFISAFALDYLHEGTVWSNALCGLAVFILSLMPIEGEVPVFQRGMARRTV